MSSTVSCRPHGVASFYEFPFELFAAVSLGHHALPRVDVRYVQTTPDTAAETAESAYVKFWRVTGGLLSRFGDRHP